jgi:hypothetical protein
MSETHRLETYKIKLYTLDDKFIRESESIPSHFTGISITYSGTKVHYKNGRYHNEGGPAIIRVDGTQVYYEDGNRHRIGGPAYIRFDDKQEYWIYDKHITKLEHDLLYSIMKLKGLI